MYIVNTSFMVDPAVHEAFLESIRKEYIPMLTAHGFDKYTFTKVLSNTVEPHSTYSLQIEVEDLDGYHKLNEELFIEYVKIAKERFKDQVLWFISLLKRVDIQA